MTDRAIADWVLTEMATAQHAKELLHKMLERAQTVLDLPAELQAELRQAYQQRMGELT